MSSQKLQILIEALNQASGPIREVQQQIEAMQNTSRGFQDLGNQITGVGRAMSLGVTAPIVGGLGYAAHAAIGFEAAMADVNKALGADTPEAMADVRETVMSLSTEMGRLPTDMAAMVTEAGKLGVARDQIEDYNRLVAQVGVGFDMSAGQAGESIAKMTNVLGYMDSQGRVNIDGLVQLSDTINYLADTGATSEAAIANVLGRAGGTTRIFGMANTSAAGLATAFLNLGDAPEVVGTALNSMLPKLQTATKQNDKFQNALKSIGIDAGQFEQAIAKDATGAFLDFVDAVSQADNVSGVISDLFGTGSDSAMLAKATQNVEAFRATVEGAGNVESGGLQKTFEMRAATTGQQLQMLAAQAQIMAINIGSALLPTILSITQALTPMVAGFAKFAGQNQGIVTIGVAIAAIAAAIGPVLVAVGAVVSAIGAIGGAIAGIQSFGLLVSAIMAGVAPATGFAGAVAGIAAAIAGIGIGPILAIGAALAAAAFLVITNWQPISAFFMNLFAQIGSAIAPIAASIQQFFGGLAAGFMTGLAPVMPVIQQFGQSLMSIGQSVLLIGQAFFNVVGAIFNFAMALMQLTPASMILSSVGSAFQGAGMSAASFGQMVGGAIAFVIGGLARLGAAAVGVIANFVAMGAGIISTVNGIAAQMFSAGARIVQMLANGIRSAIGAVTSAIGSVANAVRSMLPNSPVPTGPLTVLNNPNAGPGGNIVRMLAAGITPGPLQAAMARAIAPVQQMAMNLPLPGIAGGMSLGQPGFGTRPTGGDVGVRPSVGAGGTNNQITLSISVDASGGADGGAIADTLEERLRDLLPGLLAGEDRRRERVAYG
ncbi:phage tail tape measure protein [Leptolyngbya sp. AN02str]|uniref:phage tail tape measure protein n=1 Tax=Leptolyngbya sp. AN02str TaxID=3423363 RepID=UPI003D3239FC